VKAAVILNGISLAKKDFYKKYLPPLKRTCEVEIFETRTANDAIFLAKKAVLRRFDLIIAAGGDGTTNQVLNGLLSERESTARLPIMAVLPLGSGNDFARSLSLDHSPVGFAERLKQFKTTMVDVGEVLFSVSPPETGTASIQDKRYFINVVDVGMGPTVVRGVLDSGRALGSAVAYYQSILKTFFTYKPPMLIARSEKWEWNSNVRTFAIANARYFGNGLCIAPDAVLSDGIFNVFACGAVSVLDFVVQSFPLKQGKKVRHPLVSYYTAKEVELTSPSPIEIETDGEIIGWLPARIKVSPFRLALLV
jgi:diacylglycerol kinase (ATP)